MCMGYKDNTTTTMAELSPLTKQEVASMLVQEIAKKGDEIPDNFLHKDGIPEAIYDPDLWRNDLLIDFSLLSSSSTTELAKLRSALSQWGCFQVCLLSLFPRTGVSYSVFNDFILPPFCFKRNVTP